MRYADARARMASGDVLMVKATGLVSRLIRMVTGESINHVAMVLNQGHKGLFVVEMKEFHGWRMMPLSQWIEHNKRKEVLWGKTPCHMRGSSCFESYAMKQRARKYSYWTLVTVWISQFTGKKMPHKLVCSTFVQKAWGNCGYEMKKGLADPGDFLNSSVDINVVTRP